MPTLLASKHVWDVYARVSPTPRRSITTVDSVPESLQTSDTVKHVVNPRGHVASSDSLYMDLELPEKARNLSDEALLAAFVRGFFGGRVFAAERGLLNLFRPDAAMANFSVFSKNAAPPMVWETKRLQGDDLPALETHLFGAFKVAHLDLHAPQPGALQTTTSTVDFVFGSDTRGFSGVHRFSVIRDAATPHTARIECAHVTCNPLVNRSLGPDFLFAFHKFYSMLLFRESIGEVMRRIHAEGL